MACVCDTDPVPWACYAPHPSRAGYRCGRGAGHDGPHIAEHGDAASCGDSWEVDFANDIKDALHYASIAALGRRQRHAGKRRVKSRQQDLFT